MDIVLVILLVTVTLILLKALNRLNAAAYAYGYIVAASLESKDLHDAMKRFVHNIDHVPINDHKKVVKFICAATKTSYKKDGYGITFADSELTVERLTNLLDDQVKYIDRSNRADL